jgi:osmotically-inducible protein OsmY
MKCLKQILSVGLAGVVLVAAPARGASAAQTATSAAAKADDSALKSQIAASLKKNSVLAPRDIDVDVDQGVVTLKGTVRNLDEKTRAGKVANVKGVVSVSNRLEIDPKIDRSKADAAAEKTKAGLSKAVDATATAAEKTADAVKKGVGKAEEGVGKAADKTSEAAGKAGDKLSDASVTARVKTGLSAEKLLQNTAIDVETTDHVVTLRGTVDSTAAKARAGEIASGSEGVTRVVNLLVVRGA